MSRAGDVRGRVGSRALRVRPVFDERNAMSDTIYGPADFYAISLPNGDVDDVVRQAVLDLLGSDAVTVVDLLVVRKDADGNVDAGELAEGVLPGVDDLGETGARGGRRGGRDRRADPRRDRQRERRRARLTHPRNRRSTQ
jgi:hypothetical protein